MATTHVLRTTAHPLPELAINTGTPKYNTCFLHALLRAELLHPSLRNLLRIWFSNRRPIYPDTFMRSRIEQSSIRKGINVSSRAFYQKLPHNANTYFGRLKILPHCFFLLGLILRVIVFTLR